MSAPTNDSLKERHLAAHAEVLSACADRADQRWLERRIEYDAHWYYHPELFNMYVYRLNDQGERQGSYIDNHLEPMMEIEQYLKDNHGPGGYEVYIKRDGPLAFTHKFWIADF